MFLGQRTLPEPAAGSAVWPPGGSRHVPVSLETPASHTTQSGSPVQTFLSHCPPSSDGLAAAVDMEYEVFKSSKSSNLYKAAVLKKVTGDLSAGGRGGRMVEWLD